MDNKNFYVVGIGASAGGYDALKKFFSKIPESANDFSFVLIQHLSCDHKSLTKEWLSKHTNIKIIRIEEDTEVKPGYIYIMPEDKTLTIKDRKIIVTERDLNQVVSFAIDNFFHSLGQDLKEKAIGVILSGTGTDGSRGIKTIKEKGGAVFVQQPDSAGFDGMPNVAIGTDHPDVILPPDELAEALIKYIKNPASINEDVFTLSDLTDKEIVQEIIARLSEYSNVNFRGYKINTILRRIEKRIKINHLHSISEYKDYLRHNQEEVHVLYNDLLIGVTHFFRDAEAFKAMEEKVIPELFENCNSFETVRIWVVACSTGEEAYSIAMLCQEYVEKHNSDIPYKIFATDLDYKSIEVASAGRFRDNIVSDVSPDRLIKFFDKMGELYVVKKELRKKIIFSRHNLMSDPPFIKLDLITCRNLFIYLKPELQFKLLQTFNFALKPQSFLLLGSNETSKNLDKLFEVIDHKWKIFKNKPDKKKPFIPVPVRTSTELTANESDRFKQKEYRIKNRLRKNDEDYEEILLDNYAPTCLFINEENEVVYTHGNIKKYLELPVKRMNLNIYSMINGSSSLILRNGIRKARSGKPVMFKDVHFQIDSNCYTVNINFKAAAKEKETKLILIEFLEPTPDSENSQVIKALPKNTISYKEVEELEQELRLTKGELQFTVDELETLNEELQASNEEMHSTNEELQSTNEELQSSNEELQVVNSELQIKLDEITSLHNDINNLVNNADIAIIFLDEDLRIRMFTPAAKSNFNFLENDIGRPFSHLTHNFQYQKFIEDIREVLQDHKPIEKEIEDSNGNYFIVRILPYKIDDHKIKGIVFTFSDITQLKKVTKDLEKRTSELEASSQNWKSLVNNTPDLIARYDENIRYISVNEAMEKQLGLFASELIGKSNLELPLPNEPDEVRRWVSCVEETLKTGTTSHSFFKKKENSAEKHFYTSFVPEFVSNERKVQSVLSISRDITSLKNHEKLIETQNEQLRKINIDLDNFIYTASHDLKSPITNIEGLTNILKEKLNEKFGDSENNILDMIDTSVKKFIKTIGDLTEVTKAQRNISSEVEEVFFEEILDDVKEDLNQSIIQSEAIIKEELDVKSLTYSKHNLRSILHNLVSNAIKYRSSDRPLEISVKTFKGENGRVVLLVKDNSLGLNASQQTKIFEMFKRLHPHVGGTGIGLYIVKRIIENNGGRIEVESEEGKGSIFKVYF